jgi:hypothetical protein
MTTQILDINKIKQLLDNENIYEDSDGNKLQTIYLGSILDLTPSRKVYMTFACGNVVPCTKCNGKGAIKNKHGKRKKFEKVMKKFRLIWPTTENVELVMKLRKQVDWWEPKILCPECDGLGSLEARLDRDWWKQLEIELNEINAWAHGSEGDGCDVMISREAIEVNENDVN